MRLFKTILSICILFNSVFIAAQDKCKVLVTNAEDGTVYVKWYSENIYFDQNVYVFRQEFGNNNWTNISQHSITKGTPIPEDIVEKDKVLDVLQNKVNVTKASQLDGITKLILMIKSVQYPELSQFLGIQFNDASASKASKYRYSISHSSSETENPIGTSDWIVVSDYVQGDAPKEIKTTQEGQSLHFSWLPDEDKYMGVYVYRALKGQEMIRITSVPVLASTDEKGKFLDIFYTDDSLVTGTEYEYILKAIDYFGRESNESNKITVKIKDMEPPVAPDKVVCTVEGNNVNLYWENENVPDLAGYKIYRTEHGNTDYKCITPTLISKQRQIYTDTVSQIGVYNYMVATVDEAGNEAMSEIYPVEIKDIVPPSIPQSLIAVSDVGKIVLKWQACKDVDIMGYYIFRSIGKESSFLLLNADPVTETSFTDNLPSNAKNNFNYKVVAVDLSYNRSAFSEPAISRMPDVNAPEKPIIKNINQEKNTLKIEWYKNIEADLAGYDIYRYAEQKGIENAVKLNSKIISQIPVYTDLFPEKRTKYYYYIVAIDSSNNASIISDARSATLTTVGEDEDLFKNFTCKYNKGANEISLNWKMKNLDEKLSFIVYRKTDEAQNFKPVSGKIAQDSYKDKISKKEGDYYYRIAVITPDNNIQYSKTEKLTIKP